MVTIVLDNLLGMNTVQFGHPFLLTRSIGAVLGSNEDTDMDISFFQSRNLNLAK